MLWLIVLAIGVVAVALLLPRVGGARRTTAEVQLPSDLGVTLSVHPSRTAVIALDQGADADQRRVAPLVEHAVKEAFAFETVNAVEVRDSNGQLLERRCRTDITLTRAGPHLGIQGFETAGGDVQPSGRRRLRFFAS